MKYRAMLFSAIFGLSALQAAKSQSLYTDADWKMLRRSLTGETAPPPLKPPPVTLRTASREFTLRGHAETVRRFSCAMLLPPGLALAIAEQESNFMPAIGADGELGIMQVLPATAQQYGLDTALLMDPQYGTYAGLAILSHLLDAFPEADAIAAYNAGSGFHQRRPPVSVIQKVEHYVSQVLARKEKYRGVRCL
jgi:soluble lytic murein transglycosylase-like protein